MVVEQEAWCWESRVTRQAEGEGREDEAERLAAAAEGGRPSSLVAAVACLLARDVVDDDDEEGADCRSGCSPGTGGRREPRFKKRTQPASLRGCRRRRTATTTTQSVC